MKKQVLIKPGPSLDDITKQRRLSKMSGMKGFKIAPNAAANNSSEDENNPIPGRKKSTIKPMPHRIETITEDGAIVEGEEGSLITAETSKDSKNNKKKKGKKELQRFHLPILDIESKESKFRRCIRYDLMKTRMKTTSEPDPIDSQIIQKAISDYQEIKKKIENFTIHEITDEEKEELIKQMEQLQKESLRDCKLIEKPVSVADETRIMYSLLSGQELRLAYRYSQRLGGGIFNAVWDLNTNTGNPIQSFV
jgi:hypothetical protein